MVSDDFAGINVALPTEMILPQLATGRVTLSFGDLRSALPKVFAGGKEHDSAKVPLPLEEILAHLNPAALERSGGRKMPEIPKEIVSPFAGRGKGLKIADTTKPTPAAAMAPQADALPSLSSVIKSARTPAVAGKGQQGGGAPTIPSAPSKPPVQPSIPASSPTREIPPQGLPAVAKQASPPTREPIKPATSKPIKPPTREPIKPTGLSVPPKSFGPVGASDSLRPGGQSLPNPVLPKSVEGRLGTAASMVGAHAPTPVPSGSAPAPGSSSANPSKAPVTVPLRVLCDGWPDEIRDEIQQTSIINAIVGIPYHLVEDGLKSGRLAFTWKEVRSWLQTDAQLAASEHEATKLDLPLRAVAPLFMHQNKLSPAQAKEKKLVPVDQEIPDLFHGAFNSGKPDGQVPDPAVTRPVDTNYYSWEERKEGSFEEEGDYAEARSAGTEFVARCATPNEVVSRAVALDGVVGAVVALPDGLSVANDVPEETNADTMAAFLPHLFAKVSQCTQELRMGELNNLNFTVGTTPWKIFKVNALYFAAFGAEAQPLPTAQLAALAAELDHNCSK